MVRFIQLRDVVPLQIRLFVEEELYHFVGYVYEYWQFADILILFGDGMKSIATNKKWD